MKNCPSPLHRTELSCVDSKTIIFPIGHVLLPFLPVTHFACLKKWNDPLMIDIQQRWPIFHCPFFFQCHFSLLRHSRNRFSRRINSRRWVKATLIIRAAIHQKWKCWFAMRGDEWPERVQLFLFRFLSCYRNKKRKKRQTICSPIFLPSWSFRSWNSLYA